MARPYGVVGQPSIDHSSVFQGGAAAPGSSRGTEARVDSRREVALPARRLLVAIVALALATAIAMPDSSWAPQDIPLLQAPAAASSAIAAATDLEVVGAALRRLAEQRRQARLRALRGRPTVPAALERAALRGELSSAALRRARRTIDAARRISRGSASVAAAEVGVVLARTRELAAALRLKADRIPAQ